LVAALSAAFFATALVFFGDILLAVAGWLGRNQ
jgi:hypothetical protein